MKNKKGFTLVEVLGVITILAALALIAVPTVDNIITKNREKMYQAQITTIKNSLKTWGDAYTEYLPEDGEDALVINLGTLKVMGFIDEDIKNPNTNLCFSNDMSLSISAVKQGYTYNIDEESGLDGNDDDCSVTVSNDLLYLLGNNTVVLQNGNEYKEPGFFAVDGNGEINTSSVTQIIKDKDGNVVSSIDASLNNKAPYTVTYTYGETVLTRTVNVFIGDPVGTQYLFDYTGEVQTKSLYPGTYKLEVWGAQGGYRSSIQYGGLGGYSNGELVLTTSTTIYVYTGGSGNTGGFNGGGIRLTYKGGGGASDIRIGVDSLYSRVIVAGGGGSDGSSSKVGMYGGGTIGGTTMESYGTGGYGGTQIGNSWITAVHSTNVTTQADAMASFGYGGNGIFYSSGYGGAGGGGWYGGSGAYPDTSADDDRGGGGGSGWIYTASTFTTWQTGNATDAAKWLLNSSYYLSNAQTVAGNASIPTHDGSGTMTGNSGNGYVKITKIA